VGLRAIFLECKEALTTRTPNVVRYEALTKLCLPLWGKHSMGNPEKWPQKRRKLIFEDVYYRGGV